MSDHASMDPKTLVNATIDMTDLDNNSPANRDPKSGGLIKNIQRWVNLETDTCNPEVVFTPHPNWASLDWQSAQTHSILQQAQTKIADVADADFQAQPPAMGNMRQYTVKMAWSPSWIRSWYLSNKGTHKLENQAVCTLRQRTRSTP